jgi:hypothetical protein
MHRKRLTMHEVRHERTREESARALGRDRVEARYVRFRNPLL